MKRTQRTLAAAAIAAACTAASTARAAGQVACWSDDTIPPLEQDVSSTGDIVMDALLTAELARLVQLSRVNPAFVLTQQEEGRDAAAIPAVRDGVAGKDGTIVLGQSVLLVEASLPARREVAAVNVVTHEFGHVVQFRHGSRELRSGLECELGADYLAGHLLSSHPLYSDSVLLAHVSASYAQAGGDDHGRRLQRLAAFAAGLRGADRELPAAVLSGERVVREIMDTVYNQSGLPTLRSRDDRIEAHEKLRSHGLTTRVGMSDGQPVFITSEVLENIADERIAIRWHIELLAHKDEEPELISRRGCQVIIPAQRRARLEIRSRALIGAESLSASIGTPLKFVAFVTAVGEPDATNITCPGFTLLPTVVP